MAAKAAREQELLEQQRMNEEMEAEIDRLAHEQKVFEEEQKKLRREQSKKNKKNKKPVDVRGFTTSSVPTINSSVSQHKTTEERPIVVAVVGHVDSGKTTLMDTINSTSLQHKENRGISQQITTFYHPETNIIYVDTPGHAPFSKSRERCVAVADVILVIVDMYDGIVKQIMELIAPYVGKKRIVYAMNKIDTMASKTDSKTGKLYDEFSSVRINEFVTNMTYELTKINEENPQIFPVSAITGEGIKMMIHHLQKCPPIDYPEDFKCYVLDMRSDSTAETIILKGTVKVGDDLYLADQSKVHINRVTEFGKNLYRIKGVGLNKAIPGEEISMTCPETSKRIYEPIFSSYRGVNVYANSYCALEAILTLVSEFTEVKNHGVGEPPAAITKDQNPLILFNVEAGRDKVVSPVIYGENIYQLLTDLKQYFEDRNNEEIEANKQHFIVPVVLRHENVIFRHCNPLVIEVTVSTGRLIKGARLFNGENEEIGTVSEIRDVRERVIEEAVQGTVVTAAIITDTTRPKLGDKNTMKTMMTRDCLRLLQVFKKLYKPGEIETCRSMRPL